MKMFFVLLGVLWSMSAIAGDTLMVRTAGGTFGDAFEKAFVEPFAKEYAIDYQMLGQGQGGLAIVKAEAETNTGVTDLSSAYKNSVMSGCDQGLFLPIGKEFDEDRFIEGAITECGVGLVTYQTAIATQSESKIRTVEDFFDPSIPGSRGMIRRAEETLELALLGADIQPDRVNEVLQTPEGVDLAFETMGAIKDRIIWYQSGSQATQMLIDEQVVAGVGYDGRWLKAQNRGYEINILRDGFVTGLPMVAVTSYSDNKELAKKFLHYATRPDVNARFMEHAPYGPTIKDHNATVSKRYLFHPDYVGNRVVPDADFWYENSERINKRFTYWISQ